MLDRYICMRAHIAVIQCINFCRSRQPYPTESWAMKLTSTYNGHDIRVVAIETVCIMEI